MSHGGLPPRRPDQQESRTPRTVQPGGRAVQVTNSKTEPLTVEIVNKPGDPVVVQDGGVLGCLSNQAYAADGATTTLLPAISNAGYQLWYLTISSFVATDSGAGVVTTDDVVQRTDTGRAVGAIVNGIAGTEGFSSVSAEFDLKGVELPNDTALQLINGLTGYTHRTSAVIQYTLV